MRDFMRRVAEGVIFKRRFVEEEFLEGSSKVIPEGGLQDRGFRKEGCRKGILRRVAGEGFQEKSYGRGNPGEKLKEQEFYKKS